jgi:hypothetical protein
MRLRVDLVVLLFFSLSILWGCSPQGEINSEQTTLDTLQAETGENENGLPETSPTYRDSGQDPAPATTEPDLPKVTSTPDTRLSPEDWQSWPVIPTLSPAMIDVYQRGLSLGNRPNAFSKIGDCQIIPDVFLGFYDSPAYILPEDLEHLQAIIDQFSGSFAREGMALKGGFVFPTVFSPLRADSSFCDPGETPFECELRVHQPTFVLISMEFRYDGRTAETHEKYLRSAVEYALEREMVPILATKADNFEGDHSLNLVTARIAYEYDLPLWNYWSAVQRLPDHGIDWERDSYGFHVTPAAWYVRSQTFLEVLESLLNDVLSAD